MLARSPTRKLPLIPTPPATTKAPEVGEVDAVEPVMFKPDALNVLPKALTPERTYEAVLPMDALLLEPVK